jgi:predicted aldo/keto reductase-like oxidoreductase
MEKRKLGKTGLMVSVIGFGGIKLPIVERDDATELLNAALDMGINFLDTARGYGDSEEKIGAAISHRRDEFYISTKSPVTTSDRMKRDIETSLKNLRTDRIDLYLCHNLRHQENYETIMGTDGALKALQDAKSQGMIDHIGFSSHRFHETMRKGILSGEFEAVMLSYNILNDELVDEEILPLAKENDLGVIIMKPLAGGALASVPSDMNLGEVAITATQALRFVLANDAVTLAIPGMTSIRELEENVAAGETYQTLTEEEKSEMVKAAEALGKDFCRGCGYCQPCPEEIRIPIILRHAGYYSRYGLEDWARGRYRMVEVKADACVECGQCEEKCPYDLPIIQKLKEAHAMLSAL